MQAAPVLILSNNPTLSHSLERWLMQSEGLEVRSLVAEHYDIDCLEMMIGEDDPIIAFALRMPAVEDFATIQLLRSTYPNIRIIAIAPVCSDEYRLTVKGMGASTCIAYKNLYADLIPAVRQLFRAQNWKSIS